MKQHESCGKNPATEEKGFLFSFFVAFLGSGWKNDASAAAAASLVKLKQMVVSATQLSHLMSVLPMAAVLQFRGFQNNG